MLKKKVNVEKFISRVIHRLRTGNIAAKNKFKNLPLADSYLYKTKLKSAHKNFIFFFELTEKKPMIT